MRGFGVLPNETLREAGLIFYLGVVSAGRFFSGWRGVVGWHLGSGSGIVATAA